MATHTKMTPFARLLLVIVIVAPLAYLGASYYNGEDPMQRIRESFSSEKVETVNASHDLASASKTELIEKIEALELRIAELELKIEQMETNK